jgi:MFS family permease
MALHMAIFMGGTPAGAPLLGWVAEHFGARWTLIGGGALTALGTVVAVTGFARRQGVVLNPRVALLSVGIGHVGQIPNDRT